VPQAFHRLDQELQAASSRQGCEAIVHVTRELLLGGDMPAEDHADPIDPHDRSFDEDSIRSDSNSRKLFHKRLKQLREGRVRDPTCYTTSNT
jgi:hypothetical protein